MNEKASDQSCLKQQANSDDRKTTEHTESEVEVRANYDFNKDFKTVIDQNNNVRVAESRENEKEPESTEPFIARLNTQTVNGTEQNLSSGANNSAEWQSAEFAGGIGNFSKKESLAL